MIPSQLPDIGLRPCACDTETSGLFADDGARVAVVSIAYEWEDQIVGWAFPFDQGQGDKLPQGSLFGNDHNLPQSEWEALIAWLLQRWLVMHNAKYDLHMMSAGTREWDGIDLQDQVQWDTSLGCRELWPIEPTGLQHTAERLALQGGGERDAEQALKQALKNQNKRVGKDFKKRYDLLSWDTMEPYSTTDAVQTLLLAFRQWDEIGVGHADIIAINRELEVCKLLYRMEKRGIGFDAAACLQAAGLLRAKMGELAKALPFTASQAGAIAYWFGTKPGQLGLTPYDFTDGGRAAINDVALRKMANDNVPFVAEYQAWSRVKTALSMWYEAYPSMIGDDGRLRTNYRQTKEEGARGGGVVSGRFSVERINLQAIPHKSRLQLGVDVPTPRQFFRARPGYVLWEADLSQAELRVAAKMAKCKRMLQLIEDGADPHGETAIELFDTKLDADDFFKYRQIAKRGNFSFIFGVGPETFRATLFKEAGIRMSLAEAKVIVDAWRALYPEFGRAIWRDSQFVEANRYVPLINGRRRWFYPMEYAHKAFNQRVQGSLAEFAKEWALETDKRWDERLLLLIHDSQVMELPEGMGEQVMPEVAALGASLGTKWFGVKMDVDYGVWAEH